mmetsp:Transcript_39779/g.110584  ORF Transcript_39779/g.110584 Transcript_39779/m.110584 type:complete len:233 (-) Transcript_39779:370-1068(-)
MTQMTHMRTCTAAFGTLRNLQPRCCCGQNRDAPSAVAVRPPGSESRLTPLTAALPLLARLSCAGRLAQDFSERLRLTPDALCLAALTDLLPLVTRPGHLDQSLGPSWNSSSVTRALQSQERIDASVMLAPMKTSSCRRSPCGHFLYRSAPAGHSHCGVDAASHCGPPFNLIVAPAWLHSTAVLWSLADQTKPLERSTPSKPYRSTAPKRRGWNGRSARYTKLEMPYSSVSGL